MTAPLDPLKELAAAQSDRPDVQPVNLRALSPFHRALLVIDGTVTKFIEAYTLEPVEIERLERGRLDLDADHRWLAAPAGTSVVTRRVVIRGRYSRTVYVLAESLVVSERLPSGIRDQLEVQGEGIGRVLNQYRLETRREILWFSRERAEDLHPVFRGLADGELITRTYRIMYRKEPIVLITEQFPATTDALPSLE